MNFTGFLWNSEKNCLYCGFENVRAGVTDVFGFRFFGTSAGTDSFQLKYENRCFYARASAGRNAADVWWQPLNFRCISFRPETYTEAQTDAEQRLLSRNLSDAFALVFGTRAPGLRDGEIRTVTPGDGWAENCFGKHLPGNLDFLGSSIFFGAKSFPKGYGLSDILAENRKNARIQKETVSGTTLAVRAGRADSYAERMDLLSCPTKTDALVIQLSTNDFSRGVPVGALSDCTPAELTAADGSGADRTTVCGAIEYILAHASHRSPKLLRADGKRNIMFVACPILDTWAHNEQYRAFAEEVMPQILAKWQLFYCDMFHSFSLYEKNAAVWAASGLTDAGQSAEFCDSIHPNLTGYVVDFAPKVAGGILDMSE